MENLVSLYHGKEARVKTWDIWRGFGYSHHRYLKEIVTKHKQLFEEKGSLFSVAGDTLNKKVKGRPDESYFLNERQFMLLVMLSKNTVESIDLKNRIENEFFRMRQALSQFTNNRKNEDWQNVRKDGKAVYLQKRDTIKSFVDYATEQGSKSADMYYANLAKMENAALFIFEQKYPNLREVMSIKQLMQVATADQIIEKALEDGMNQKMHYKDIYPLAKDRIIQFSNIIGKSMITEFLAIEKQDSLKVSS